jgi:hypothetical protein
MALSEGGHGYVLKSDANNVPRCRSGNAGEEVCELPIGGPSIHQFNGFANG